MKPLSRQLSATAYGLGLLIGAVIIGDNLAGHASAWAGVLFLLIAGSIAHRIHTTDEGDE